MRLAPDTLSHLAGEVQRFAYPREEQDVGIVHLGLGAFHRAHQAVYTDRAMDAGDRNWAIKGVSLRSPAVCNQLVPQDGLFTVTARDGSEQRTRLVGALRTVLVGSEHPRDVMATLSAPATKIVTLTITEKGYLEAPDGTLSLKSAQIAHDLANSERPQTIYGFLARGLEARRREGLPGLTIISCDNLAANGVRLADLLGQFLDLVSPSLATWFANECTCPSTMVDRIVPATTEALVDEIARRIGVRDEAAVVTEPFTQWVIEDRFAGPRPRWEVAGAQLVADVKPYEDAKLRMLNGAHSALAYCGLERGHTFVHEAVADPEIGALVSRLMLHEAAPTLPSTAGLDPVSYSERLLERFGNAALEHRLEQIAMDGSQKIPQRWFPTLRAHQLEGRQCPAILDALAAWLRYLKAGPTEANEPLAATLTPLCRNSGVEAGSELFGPGGGFSQSWTATDDDLAVLRRALVGAH